MPTDPNLSARIRQIRDLMLQYIYFSGRSGKPEVPVDEIKEALNLSPEEYLLGYDNLQSRRLLIWPGAAGCIALNLNGRFEVATGVRQLPTADDVAASTDVEESDTETDQMVVELQQSLQRMRERSGEMHAELPIGRCPGGSGLRDSCNDRGKTVRGNSRAVFCRSARPSTGQVLRLCVLCR